MINFNQLRVFYYAAKCESFTVAADKLCITQPAVTAQIRLLEDRWSLKLFKKKGRNIFLTDEGIALYEYAQRIFEYEKEMEGAIEELRDVKRGILRLATTKTYARYIMPFLIGRFHSLYPKVVVHLDEGSSLEMMYSLLDFRNEVAIIAKVEDHPDVSFIPFSHEELVLIVGPDHPLAGKGTVSLGELAREPIIMKEIGSGTRRLVNQLYKQSNLSPQILMETSNTEFIKQLVQRGEGVSFVVREAAALEIGQEKLATVSIEGGRIFLDISIAFLKGQHLSQAAKAFLDMLGKIAPKLGPDQGIRAIMGETSPQL